MMEDFDFGQSYTPSQRLDFLERDKMLLQALRREAGHPVLHVVRPIPAPPPPPEVKDEPLPEAKVIPPYQGYMARPLSYFGADPNALQIQNIRSLISLVGSRYDVHPDFIYRRSTNQCICAARDEVIYLMASCMGMTSRAIAKRVERESSSVRKGVSKHFRRLVKEKEV